MAHRVGVEAFYGKVKFTQGIVASKLMPPANGPTHLVRTHLIEAIANAQTARLVLIRAAAGFGKTTLMQQYAAHCRASRREVVWLRLDAADNDLQRFLLHLDAGLRGTRGHVGSGDALGMSVIERVAAHGKPLAILLDDFEAIQSPPVLAFTQKLIEALPPGNALVIASRVTPELGIGRIRARGELLDINPAALRFTLAEATAFIRDKCGLSLRDADIATLQRCTEGWATAIYLATLSLRTRSDSAAFVASFSGTNLELAEYLAEDILARQSDACRSFLLDTSVLPQFSASLCDAVTGRGDSREMLDYLERSNLFLVPLDGERNTYRYHRLFASFLRHRLRASQPGREASLHAAAARWYLDAQRPVPAIDHLLDAGNQAGALAQIARHSRQLLGAGRVRLLMRWLDRIAADLLATQPWVGLTYAWALLLNRRYADAMRMAQRIVESCAGQPEQDDVTLEAEAIRGVLLALTDQVEACRQTSAALLDRLPDPANFTYYSLANSLAFSCVSMHCYDEARGVLSRALRRAHDHPFVVMRAIAETLEGTIDLVQGRLGIALARLDASAANASVGRRDDISGESTGTSMDGARALALYERNALDRMAHLLADALPQTKSVGTTEALISTHVLSARAARLNGDVEQWQRLLAELEQTGRAIQSDRAICAAWLERARVATLEGRFDAAEQALRAAQLHGDWASGDVAFLSTEIDQPLIARARLDVAERRYAEAASTLREALTSANARQRHWRALKLRLLLALALDGGGDRDGAFETLTEALRMASHEGYVRTFLDEGERLMRLVGAWAECGPAGIAALGIAPAFVEQLLGDTKPSGTLSPRTAATKLSPYGADIPVESLTARELVVLHMLSAGHRNRVIAEKLFVCETTVKTHLRKINAKLGAQNRTQAVAIARTQGLIP
ncbi:LuxR C-terminal-related transcriptional regulator [Paraburkholderia sediminicola]|uniref:LuxR C-terminal-related transcriptional regulator n=1 Tax=Paraburkholderia sediminicola TaxID=458836 RepID=UPI0038BD81B3